MLVWTLNPRMRLPKPDAMKDAVHQRRVHAEKELKVELAAAMAVSLTFDLWMSNKSEDIFAVCAHYICTTTWTLQVSLEFHKHCRNNINLHSRRGCSQVRCLDLIAVKTDSTGSALAELLRKLVDKYDLKDKVTCYVRDQGGNLKTMSEALSGLVKHHITGCVWEFDCIAHGGARLKNPSSLFINKKPRGKPLCIFQPLHILFYLWGGGVS